MVSWKSSKLGSNFYRPNEFTKNSDDLDAKLLDSKGNPKYSIDVIILSCLSFTAYEKYCKLLSKFSNENTVVLLDSNFGVELEKLAIQSFLPSHRCILSVLCDAEVRTLSSGSYALVSDRFQFFFGVTYLQDQNFDNKVDEDLLLNLKRVQYLFDDENSKFNMLLSMLQKTNMEKITKIAPTNDNQMALKVWEHIIPRISLNILSIVFEQFDYDRLLENVSALSIFKDLVKEMTRICYKQCRGIVPAFTRDEFVLRKEDALTFEELDQSIEYSKIVETAKKRKRQMDKFTTNEYPEFLTLSFEAYCFYHRLEMPAYILLYQPVLLAEKYSVGNSSLNFLFGFYSRLLSISGLSIEGGSSKVTVPSLLFGRKSHFTTQPSDDTLVEIGDSLSKKDAVSNKSGARQKVRNMKSSKDQKLGKSKYKGKRRHKKIGIEVLKSPLSANDKDLELPPELQALYLGAENAVNLSLPQSSVAKTISKLKCPLVEEILTEGDDSDSALSASTYSESGDNNEPESTDFENGQYGEDENGEEFEGSEGDYYYEDANDGGDTPQIRPMTLPLTGRNKLRYGQPFISLNQDDDDDRLVIDASIKLPNFSKRGSKLQNLQPTYFLDTQNEQTHSNVRRPLTSACTSNFEKEVRQDSFGISRYYLDVYNLGSGQRSKDLVGDKALKNLWKLQRKYHLSNAQIFRPSAQSADPLQEHVDMISRANMGGILDLTTSRYGHVDASQKIYEDLKSGKGGINRLMITDGRSAAKRNEEERQDK